MLSAGCWTQGSRGADQELTALAASRDTESWSPALRQGHDGQPGSSNHTHHTQGSQQEREDGSSGSRTTQGSSRGGQQSEPTSDYREID